MKLGAFSISLNVKDIKTSQKFYKDLGFTVFAGAVANNYLIMKNEDSIIGLFQGMFDKNIITFNPGWDSSAKTLDSFDDVRSIMKNLKKKGVNVISEADENGKGPASFIAVDPDGNTILVDQHI